jgi:phosphoglycerol transferase MdoB-like AlkP superfamily enzyme
MDNSFIHTTDALVLCFILFIAMIAMVAVGKIAGRLWRKESSEPTGGVNSLLTAVFALFGFILAFTFGMSGARYENVRDVIVEEANTIGTSVLRADLYSDSVRDAFHADFKRYLDARIAYYDNATNPRLLMKAKSDALKAQDALWARAMHSQDCQTCLFLPVK